ncbi:hypothetical protein GUITHDRAFT_165501 [Guillardia theta CCMP2712]|uniref:Uncharacterized protein n=1 Tax=Guillardia theta (strain CCMP2712) TaxID=905079 RepID=L1INB0_GUITC|nr:hypothetical protein GUITHDRAFT_165501 [Guillardia theta CCMP2712]EKX37379.1 hypothetical protein GUITHDRAFT_165501 [Guillardia theta CCMP2712]|eukprot:XP_005824359.1 hypothetical protein GUITHDRAFT_165501 [Guillardia theta CCMP2712]
MRNALTPGRDSEEGSNNVSFREYLDIRKRAGSSFSLDRGSRGSSAALSSAASSSSSLLHSVKEEESRDLRRVRQTSEEEEEEEEEDGTWEGAGASVLAGAAAGVRGGARAREREGAGARGAARENWLIVVHTLLYRFQVFGHFSMAMKKCLAREEKVRKQLVELQELLRRREEDKADLEKELRKSQFELRLASAGEEKRVEKLSELNEANLALKEEVKKMRRREEELQEKLQEKSADLNAFILKSQKQMDAMREEERIKERRIGELEEELQGLREEKEKTEVRVKYFQQQMSRFADYDLVKERMEALAGEVERLEQERRGREEVIEELREELSSDKNKLHALNLRVQNLILQRDHIQEEARAAQARLQEELDRVTDKVGGLMADKGQLKEPQLHELQRSLREKLGLVLVEDGRIREEFEEAVMRFKEKGVKGLPSSLGISRTESLAAPSKLMRRKEYERALPPAAAAAAASSRHVPYLPEEWNLVEETARKLVEERGRIVGELEDQLGMIPLGNLQLLQEVGELREKLGEARQQLGASRKLMEAHQRTMEKLQLKLINLGGVRSTSDMDKADSESQTRSWEEVVEEEALRLGVSEGRVKELEEERERLREEVKNRSERVANLKREVAIYRRRTEDSWGRVRQELEKEGGPVAPARRNEKLVDRSILDRLKAGSRESKGGETVGEEEVLDAIAEIYNSWYMEKANNCSQDTMLSFLYRHMLQQHKDPEVAEARSKLVLGRVGRLVGVRTTGLRVSFFSSLLNMDQDNLRDTAQHRLVTYMKILSSIPLRCEQEEEEATPPLSSKALLPRVLHFLKSLHSSEICWLSLEEATSFVRSRAKHGRRERIGPLLQELRTHSQREEEAESSWRAGVSVSVDFLLDLLVRHESSSASFSSLRDPFSASPEGGEEEEEGMDPEVFRIGVLRLAFGREFAGTLRSLLEGVKEQLDVSAAWHSYRLISLTVDQARKTIERLLMAPELVREAIRLAEEEEEEKGKAELLSSRGRAEPSNSIGRSVGAWKGDVTRLRARKGSTQAPEEAAAAEVTAAAAAAAAAPPSLTAHGVSPRLLLWKPADKGKSSGISVQMNLALSQEVSSARSKGGLLSARASQSPRPPLTKKPRPQTAVNPAQRR